MHSSGNSSLAEAVRADFDRIALLAEAHKAVDPGPYANFLLAQVPRPCRKALEIGCGTGEFSRLLAAHAAEVVALDFSPQMIRIARERAANLANIDFREADLLTYQFPAEEFDCAVAMATLHHLPMELMLAKLRSTLRKGGTLMVLDLFHPEGSVDQLFNLVALGVGGLRRLFKHGRLRPPAAVRAAWAEHEHHDTFLTLREVRAICAELLPGATVCRHLLWRYSIVWRKP